MAAWGGEVLALTFDTSPAGREKPPQAGYLEFTDHLGRLPLSQAKKWEAQFPLPAGEGRGEGEHLLAPNGRLRRFRARI